MKKNLLILAISLFGHVALAQQTDVILSKYYSVKNALVSSDEKMATASIQALQKTVKAESPFKLKDNLNREVDKLAKANSIEKQRGAFNEVSTIVWQLVKSTEKVNQPVYYQYCPMKKAYWLSDETAIKNPYYGSAMLTCGKVTETKK